MAAPRRRSWREHANALEPLSPLVHYLHAASLSFAGRFDEAVGAAECLLASGRAALWVGVAGLVYAKAGRTADARRLLAELDERAIRGEYIAPWGGDAHLEDTTNLRDVAESDVDRQRS